MLTVYVYWDNPYKDLFKMGDYAKYRYTNGIHGYITETHYSSLLDQYTAKIGDRWFDFCDLQKICVVKEK